MRILNLILYSDNGGAAAQYTMMRAALRPYLKSLAVGNQNSNNSEYSSEELVFEYYFYQYDASIADGAHAFRDEDMLLIGGTESFLPGILDKTIKALQICRSKPYDFVVRSNASTVIDFERLSATIRSNSKFEFGGPVLHLRGDDPISGITNHKFFGLGFVWGTCIIMSRNTVNLLLDHSDQIDRTVIDDVTISATLTNTLGLVPVDLLAYCNQFDTRERAGIIVYRNRSDNRWLDAANVGHIARQLMEKVDIVRLLQLKCVNSTEQKTANEFPAILREKTATVDQLYTAAETMRLQGQFVGSFALGLASYALYTGQSRQKSNDSSAATTTPLWRINDVIAISGFYARSFVRAAEAAREGLQDTALPPCHVARFQANLKFSEDNI